MGLSENVDFLKVFLPTLPPALRQAVLHALGRTEQSKYVDLRSALVTAVTAALMQPKHPQRVSDMQRLTLHDPGVKGRLWVSTYAAPVPPEADVRDAVVRAVRDMAHEPLAGADVRIPELAPVEAEWTGYRAGVPRGAAPPAVSERQKYAEMMKECSSPATLLYLHGGAYYLCDPVTHRPMTAKLAKLTGGRCYSVRYRLAPQHPFPSALLDALVSYLTLLYPPPDAFHEPVKPEHIAFGGDSAGGNLTLALLQLLLEFQRKGTRIMWHGESRSVPLPAAVTLNSPWLDITESDPIWKTGTPFDYLPRHTHSGAYTRQPPAPCPAWPASPPRRAMYADDALVDHPLVSVATARSWAGAPPVYMCTGWEILASEDRFLARKLIADGVALRYEDYEGMPHVFVSVIPHEPSSERCFVGWAGFIKEAVDGTPITSSAVLVRAKTLNEAPLKFDELSDITEEEIRERIRTTARFKDEPDTLAKI